MGKGFNVTFDKKGVAARVQKAADRATFIMANELLKDANKYARMDTGQMIKSSQIASQPEKGVLVWDTPYAKRVYYTGTPNTSENPNASKMWAHKAHQENREKYQRMAQKVIKEDV